MATCSVPNHDNAASGDDLYGPRACWQALVDWAWQAFGFVNEYWDDGFGYEDPCNRDLPVNRTMAAIWLLCYSADDYDNDEYSNNCLHWARRYCWNQVDELRAFCGDGSAVASASGSQMKLFLGYWYDQDVSVRASTLLHEARHLGGKSHNAKFPKGSVFGEGKGGADSEWGYEGAWMFEVLYLWWFYADGRRTTTALRQRARQEANVYLDNAFATHPGFTIA
jgi:hypothetical protein